MKKKQTVQPVKAIVFPRAAPDDLAMFDPDTKRCTMNCGPHVQDTRTSKERKFLCDECVLIKPIPSNAISDSVDASMGRIKDLEQKLNKAELLILALYESGNLNSNMEEAVQKHISGA